jgi:hypothetical protein
LQRINERLPLIVVKRCYYDEFLSGRKTIEYRRHKGQFTNRFPLGGSRCRCHQGGEIRWVEASYTAIHHVLTNPIYAGAYVYGRTRQEIVLDLGAKDSPAAIGDFVGRRAAAAAW